MHDIYKISNTQYLGSEKEYSDPTLYSTFQEDYLKFKDGLINDAESKKIQHITSLEMATIYYLKMKNYITNCC